MAAADGKAWPKARSIDYVDATVRHASTRNLLGLAVAALLLVPSAAAAATTIGGDLTKPADTAGPASPRTYFQNAVGAKWQPAAPGVITSWRIKTGATASGTAKLRVIHPLGNGQFRAVATSAAVALTPNRTIVSLTRLRIAAGDYIGIDIPANEDIFNSGASPGESVSYFDPPLLDGSTSGTSGSPLAGELLVTATVEPDADGDGYGDETQDACPTDASTQGPCPADLSITARAAPNPAVTGGTVVYTLTATDNSATNPAAATTVTDTLPDGVVPVATAASQGSCGGTVTIQCSLGTVPAGASATVAITVTPTAVGRVTDTAAIASAGPDPNPADNVATVTSTILGPIVPLLAPPFAGAGLVTRQAPVRNGYAAFNVTCPATCSGKIALSAFLVRSQLRHAAAIGHAAFTVAGSPRARVSVHLSERALRVLTKAGSLKAFATVTAHDYFGTAVTASAAVTLIRHHP